MSRHIATILVTIGLLFSLQWSAAAQGAQVQLRLTNTMPQRVDYYVVRPAGAAPKFVGSLSPSMMVDVDALPSDRWLFAVERRQFQAYTVRPEPFQHLTLAPAGSQGQAQVAMAKQAKIASPVAASSAPAMTPPPVTTTTVAAPPVAASAVDTCRTMADVKSVDGGQTVVITFVNRTNETRGINWVNFEGLPQSYGMIGPGESSGIETSTKHPWMLTDGPGNCIEMYMPSATKPVFDITVPSPPGGFGPE